jgi:cytochrome P450
MIATQRRKMTFTKPHSLIRLKGSLPPSRHLPVAYQTFCCRYSPVAYLESCRLRLGHRFTVYTIDMPPLVFLTRPDDIHAILSGDPTKLHPGASVNVIEPLVGDRSFMLLEEDEHMHRRRAITPAFHQRLIAHHTRLLTETVEREVASWPLDEVVPLDPYVCTLTLRMILRAVFGDDDALPRLHERLTAMLGVTTSILFQEPKARHIPGWRGLWRTFVKQRAEVDEVLRSLIRRRRAETVRQPSDLLDLLLVSTNADGSMMSEQEIRDDIVSMILAGHETTAGEITWALQLLAHNPRVQQCLIAEIDRGTENDYLTATVHETIRRKPVFLFAIPREVVMPIEIGEWNYAPPVRLLACTYLMHHDPELYLRPEEFRPERFLEEPPEPRTWLPWGGGRKHCLGHHFALLEVQTVLRHVLAAMRVLPASTDIERPRWRSATLVPHAGGRIVLRRRSTARAACGARSKVY